jgi:glycerol-3-phosphate O-acyltransferase
VASTPAIAKLTDPPSERAPDVAELADPYTCMTPRFGWLAQFFARHFFRDFAFDPEDAARLKRLEQRGAVIYVMRYSSRLDYFLFNWLFLAAGIRRAGFATGLRYYLYRPLPQALGLMARRLWLRTRLGREGMRDRSLAVTRGLVEGGGTLFLFLRTNQIRSRVLRRRGALAAAQKELDYLSEVVDTTFGSPREVALVPLALFWRKGARARRRFLNVFYGGPERPTDTSKVLSFLWNYENLALRVGTPIDLRGFVDERRSDGVERVAKQVRRSILIFLRREERPVLGAALRPRARIEEAVLRDADVRSQIEAEAASSGRSLRREESRALRYVREIAASPSPSMLAALDVIVSWIFRKLFVRIEVTGLDRTVEEAKLRPLVLVPSHRSHFDYLILSWLFYERHLVPPLVAAGINLAFWPLGPIFRRAGAFFLRRSFAGNRLYASVFRSYVQMLLKDGVTQEFFIEGTRSRTGKTLQPRLGMLDMILEAFGRGVRQDVALIPVAFTYERLVEESSITEERRGKRKSSETLIELIRARSVLKRRFGSVTVRFGEPISLSDSVDLTTAEFAHEICRQINQLVTAGRSSVSATALLGGSARAVRQSVFAERVSEVARVLEISGFARSENLEECLVRREPERAAGLLLQAGLVERLVRPEGTLLSFPDSSREALAYYRTTIGPGLVWPAVLALGLWRETPRSDVIGAASEWLDLLRLEYFPPGESERCERLNSMLEHFESRGWLLRDAEAHLQATPEGRSWLGFFASQLLPVLETYNALFAAAAGAGVPVPRKRLLADAQRALEDQRLLGEARCTEAVCPTTLANALKLLLEEGVLVVEGDARSDEALFGAGPDFERLGPLRERLGSTMRTR